jgi:hypothetical protein
VFFWKTVLLSSYFQKYKARTCQPYGIFLCDGSYIQSWRIEQLDLMVMILACIQEEQISNVSWVIHSLSTVLSVMPVACDFRNFTCHLNSLCIHAFYQLILPFVHHILLLYSVCGTEPLLTTKCTMLGHWCTPIVTCQVTDDTIQFVTLVYLRLY